MPVDHHVGRQSLSCVRGEAQPRELSETAQRIQEQFDSRGIGVSELRAACVLLNQLGLSHDSEELLTAIRELEGGDILNRPRAI